VQTPHTKTAHNQAHVKKDETCDREVPFKKFFFFNFKPHPSQETAKQTYKRSLASILS